MDSQQVFTFGQQALHLMLIVPLHCVAPPLQLPVLLHPLLPNTQQVIASLRYITRQV